jgi:hypothetical protein
VSREVKTVMLFRENRHVTPSIGRDVWFVVQLGILGLLIYVILVLGMT